MDSPTATSAPPDWSRIERDILCPLCDYNLRGLSEARCPECGYQFNWDEVLNEHLRPHAYLFEHHPERNIQSFLRTLFESWIAWRFWKSVYPTQQLRVRRLVIYSLLIAFICLLPGIVRFLRGVSILHERQTPVRLALPPELRNKPGFQMQNRTDGQIPIWSPRLLSQVWGDEWIQTHFFASVVLAAWPWAAFATLMIMQKSMNQAKIKRAHVLRCVVYSSGVTIGFAVLSFALFGYEIYESRTRRSFFGRPSWMELPHPVLLIAASYILLTIYLIVAYHRYLRFRRAAVVVIAAQVIIGLLTLIVALQSDIFNVYLL